MLAIGDHLPDLDCEAYLPDGRVEPVSLAAYRGKWLVLFFWPLDFMPGSPAELRGYSDLAGDFDLSGAVLLGASVDSVYAHQAWVQQTPAHASAARHTPGAMRFPMLGDVSRTLALAFGVLGESGYTPHACFIANPEGRIASVVATAHSLGHAAHDSLRLLHALQSAELAAHAWPSPPACLSTLHAA